MKKQSGLVSLLLLLLAGALLASLFAVGSILGETKQALSRYQRIVL
jgi:hypothetical protein